MKNYFSFTILLLLCSNLIFSSDEIKIFTHKIPEHFQFQIFKYILFVKLDDESLDKILDSFVIESEETISYDDLESANAVISQPSKLNIFSYCERRPITTTKKIPTPIDNANKFHEFRFPPLVTKNGDEIKIRVFQFRSFNFTSICLNNKIIKSFRKDCRNVQIKDIKLLGSWSEALFILFTNFELVYIPILEPNESKTSVNFTRSLPKSAKTMVRYTDRKTVFEFIEEDSKTITELNMNYIGMPAKFVLGSLKLPYWNFHFRRPRQHWFIRAPKINKFYSWGRDLKYTIIFTERKSLTFYVGPSWVGWWLPNGEKNNTQNWKIINSPEIYEINGSKIHDFDDDLAHVILENGEILEFIGGESCWNREPHTGVRSLKEGIVAIMILPNSTQDWGYLKRLNYE